jgi:hypothetical protein
MEKCEGGPRKWEAQAVRHENGQRQMSMPVFSYFFFFNPPLTPVTPTFTPPSPPSHPNASRSWMFSTCFPLPPPPSHPNASRRWIFSMFSTRFPLPPPPSHPNASRRWTFWAFRRVSHPTTSLAPNASLRWIFFGCFDACAAATTSLASERELEVDLSGFQHLCHQHHLPRI